MLNKQGSSDKNINYCSTRKQVKQNHCKYVYTSFPWIGNWLLNRMLILIQNWPFCANCIAWTYMRKMTISHDKVSSKLTGRSHRKYLPFSNTGILQAHFQFSFSIKWRLNLLPTYRCFGNSYLKQITILTEFVLGIAQNQSKIKATLPKH